MDCDFFVSVHLARTCTTFVFYQSAHTTLDLMCSFVSYFPENLMKFVDSTGKMDTFPHNTQAQDLSTEGLWEKAIKISRLSASNMTENEAW